MKKKTEKKPGRGGARPGAGRKPSPNPGIRRTIRVDEPTWLKWQQAAVAAGLELSVWIRDCCNRRCK